MWEGPWCRDVRVESLHRYIGVDSRGSVEIPEAIAAASTAKKIHSCRALESPAVASQPLRL